MKIAELLSSFCFLLGLKSLSEQLDSSSAPIASSSNSSQKTSLPNSPNICNPAAKNRKIIKNTSQYGKENY